MGKLFINATKQFGNKIENAIQNSDGRIDGIHYSIADIPCSKKEKLNTEGIIVLREFPLYYLTISNDYLDSYLDQTPVDLGEGKKFIPNENNNKLICLNSHIDFSFFKSLPLSPYEYSINRDSFQEMVCNFYDKYYVDSYLMTPTFTFNKINSWEEVVLADTLESTKNYLHDNHKEKVILSVLLDPALLETSDVASNIINYVSRFNFIDSLSLTIISDESMYYYSKDVYKNILVFIKELVSHNINVYLQYCGIKDAIFSVLDIERFSVGWFGSYRNFDTNTKGISEISTTAFGKRIKKVLSENYMSEVPLSYLDVLSDDNCFRMVGIKKSDIETTNYIYLEQKYWNEMLKIIKKDSDVETQHFGDELIYERCKRLIKKIEDAIVNLNELISLLEKDGRMSDASKLTQGNLKYVILYKEALEEYQNRLFF